MPLRAAKLAECTSLGRVLLSSLSTSELDGYLQSNPLVPHTDKSITSKREFKKAIAEVKKLGFALVDEELTL
jgi:IclR family pca regulon transcriptional regulator